MSSTAELTDLVRACGLMADASRIAAFTGAGISAESGVPTFRDSDDALWRKYDPMEIAQIHSFMRDPTLYWEFFKEARYPIMSRAQPNDGHRALVAMERAKQLRWLITQNIDGLHQAAGSREVIELHGNTRRILCLECGAEHSWDEVYQALRSVAVPPCRLCGGQIKPDVVFFGEGLPPDAMNRAAQAIGQCDVFLAVGSSLVVHPAAMMPAQAKAMGADLIIVNMTPTPYDSMADVVLRQPAGRVLPAMAEVMGLPW